MRFKGKVTNMVKLYKIKLTVQKDAVSIWKGYLNSLNANIGKSRVAIMVTDWNKIDKKK